MLYCLPSLVDKAESILNKLELVDRKEKPYSAYLLQRLIFFYVRLGTVIQAGQQLNGSLVLFTEAFSENALKYYHCESLWHSINTWRVYTSTALDEAMHINRVLDRLTLLFSKKYPSDNFWQTTVQSSKGEDFLCLSFNVDDMIGGSIDHNEDAESKRPKVRFEYKIGNNEEVELIEFEFPIPNPDDQAFYFFEEGIDLDSLNKGDIGSMVTKFMMRHTLSTMISSHQKIKTLLIKKCGTSIYLDTLSLDRNHLPSMTTEPEW